MNRAIRNVKENCVNWFHKLYKEKELGIEETSIPVQKITELGEWEKQFLHSIYEKHIKINRLLTFKQYQFFCRIVNKKVNETKDSIEAFQFLINAIRKEEKELLHLSDWDKNFLSDVYRRNIKQKRNMSYKQYEVFCRILNKELLVQNTFPASIQLMEEIIQMAKEKNITFSGFEQRFLRDVFKNHIQCYVGLTNTQFDYLYKINRKLIS